MADVLIAVRPKGTSDGDGKSLNVLLSILSSLQIPEERWECLNKEDIRKLALKGYKFAG